MWSVLRDSKVLETGKEMVAVRLVVLLVSLGLLLIFASSSGIAWALYPFFLNACVAEHSRHFRVLPRRCRGPAVRRKDHRRRPGRAFHTQKERSGFPSERCPILPPSRWLTAAQLDAVVFYDKPILNSRDCWKHISQLPQVDGERFRPCWQTGSVRNSICGALFGRSCRLCGPIAQSCSPLTINLMPPARFILHL